MIFVFYRSSETSQLAGSLFSSNIYLMETPATTTAELYYKTVLATNSRTTLRKAFASYCSESLLVTSTTSQ